MIRSIYIPIWFYFNDICLVLLTPSIKFTFQYGSTLMKLKKANEELAKLIYIPIWFYFNGN